MAREGKSKAPRPSTGLRQLTLRLDSDLVQRLDACATAMSAQAPGLRYNRTDVVRLLLERGLAAEGFACDGGPSS